MKGYLASHFFNAAGFEYTKRISEKIRQEIPELDLYVPQDNADINDKEANDATITAELIAQGDNSYLRDCNVLIANIDGVEIDAGVASEIGYFSGIIETERNILENPIPRIIIGLYTDMRQDGSGENHFYINLYTKGLIKLHGELVKNEDEAIELVKKFIKENN